jgi:hypothetical protein
MDKSPHPLVSKSFKTPKGCHVRYVEMRKGEARVGYDCGTGGSGRFQVPGDPESFGNYPSAIVKGVRAVRLPGATVTVGRNAVEPDTRIGFELIPRYVTCRKRKGDYELSCSVHTRDE